MAPCSLQAPILSIPRNNYVMLFNKPQKITFSSNLASPRPPPLRFVVPRGSLP